MAWKIRTGEGDSATYYANRVKFEGDLVIMEEVYRTDCYTDFYTYYLSYAFKFERWSGYEKDGVWHKENNSSEAP